MDDQNPKPTRRIRYKGTHPKQFNEKYKELNPDIYSDDVAKVMGQGKTPAGMHRSICINEILDILKIQPGEIGLDATLGYGGHSIELLKKVLPNGCLYAIDVDAIELVKTKERIASFGFTDKQIIIRKLNFSNIDLIVAESGPLNFVLADLGVSSMQIDNPARGFTFKVDGPLDLRLNSTSGKTAAALLKTLTQEQLEDLLIENSDEPHYALIASAIVRFLKAGAAIITTAQLQQIITDALLILKVNRKEETKKSCQRTFQALRIAVNDELNVLDKFLAKLPDSLAPEGRVVIMSFHSGEDRRVKKSFQRFFREGVYSDVAPDVIRPSAEEIFSNPRARSTKLRWAIKA